MIPTSPTQPSAWTSASAPVSTAVPAVLAVAPAAPASRDAQTGLEQRRSQAPARDARATPSAVQPADAARVQADLAEQRMAESERREAEARRALELQEAQAETVEQLRQALRKVWDASAAVVEQALAREAEQQAGVSPVVPRAISAYESPATPDDRTPGVSHRA
ncbi:MAG: hypothetical protein MUE35_05660 [Hydrogenophaga sp.]|jgi:hypothetical protein|nr:hypothetical protein [Hydrogenophaga sp.]